MVKKDKVIQQIMAIAAALVANSAYDLGSEVASVAMTVASQRKPVKLTAQGDRARRAREALAMQQDLDALDEYLKTLDDQF